MSEKNLSQMMRAVEIVRLFQKALQVAGYALLYAAVSLVPTPLREAAAAERMALPDSYLRDILPDGAQPAGIVDCDLIAKRKSFAEADRKICNFRSRGGSLYGFPVVKWRTFGPTDVADKVGQWRADYGQTGAYKELLDTLGLGSEKWNPEIFRSGDINAAEEFINLQNLPDGTVIANLTLNADNRHLVRVQAPSRVRRVGRAPTLLAFYDQYDGHLYIHAFKLRRSAHDYVETLHARLSPLHLDFLQGNRHYLPANPADNELAPKISQRFYKPSNPYRFHSVDFTGAFVIAGQIAKLINAELAVFFVPTIDIRQTKRTRRSLFTRTTLIDTYASVKPLWYYGIPQFTIPESMAQNFGNVGFTNAICAGNLNSLGRCSQPHHIMPSNIVVMEASDMSPHIDLTEQQFFHKHQRFRGFTFLSKLILFAVVIVAAAYLVALLPAGSGIFGALQKGILALYKSYGVLGGSAIIGSASGALYAGASYVNGARRLSDIQRGFAGETMSDGRIDRDASLAAQGGIASEISGRFQSVALAKHNVNASGIRSVSLLYRGLCAGDRERADECRLRIAVREGLCAAPGSDDAVAKAEATASCKAKLGAGFNQTTGIVPRADQFSIRAGGEMVAPLFNTEKGLRALRKVRGGVNVPAIRTDRLNRVSCTYRRRLTDKPRPCILERVFSVQYWLLLLGEQGQIKGRIWLSGGETHHMVRRGQITIEGGVEAFNRMR